MNDKKIVLPCIAVAEGEIHERVITCGDPKRAEYIASLLEDAVCLAQNREFWVYNGTYRGVPVSVISHGVGCGGAVISFESMWRAGAKAIIRVGTCGGMQEGINQGSIVISTAACRDDGVTDKLIPLSYPAICDGEIVYNLMNEAKNLDVKVNKGITLTQAHFYLGLLPSNVGIYSKAGVIASENELSGLLVVSSMHNVKAGGILVADAMSFELETVESYQPDPEIMQKSLDSAIKIALGAIVNTTV